MRLLLARSNNQPLRSCCGTRQALASVATDRVWVASKQQKRPYATTANSALKRTSARALLPLLARSRRRAEAA